LSWIVAATSASALPIGFGLNQGDLQYSEIRNDHFFVYHDKRVPTEGAMVLNALEAVRPIMERWFDEKRIRPLPVILSAVTENASFANIVTDAIEIQTLGQADKSLTWHEYTHTTMYSRFRNFFGPAGDLLHVVWMPAWYLEGLAEALSVSVGSDVTAGIERWQALTGNWPTYDRLHSLYAKAGFFETGYATAGAMVSYLFRKSDPNRMAGFLASFRDYTMPWWWPWSIVPYNGFLPMDAALEELVDMNGEELYAAYKEDAKAFWQGYSKAPFLYGEPGDRRGFSSINGLRTNGRDVLHVTTVDDEAQEVALEFDADTGWATGWEKQVALEEKMATIARIVSPELSAAVDYEPRGFDPRKPTSEILLAWKTKKPARQSIKRPAQVYGLFETPKHIAWFEMQQAATRLCYVAKDKVGKAKPSCPVRATQPTRLRLLGETVERTGARRHGLVKKVWLHREHEKLTGSRNEIVAFDFETMRLNEPFLTTEARPVAVAPAGADLWVLLAERNQRTLRRYDAKGACAGMLRYKDHLLDLLALDDGSVVVGLYGGSAKYLRKIPRGEQKLTSCVKEDGPISPLLHAVRHESEDAPVDLKAAFAGADLWRKDPVPLAPEAAAQLAAAPALDKDLQGDKKRIKKAKEAAWRGRPVLLFPWIGAEDALGTQYGAVSVPLMDHLQNETLRATFLYGPASRYPYSELALTSTRFRTTIDVAVYRSQTYNGRFLKCLERDAESRCVDSTVESGFLDEKGGRLETDTPFQLLGGSGSFALGAKYAHLNPYLGPTRVRNGWLAEPMAGLSLAHALGTFSWSNYLSGRIAPAALNENFDYNQVGFGSTISRTIGPLWATRLSLGIEGSRTRGPKRRELQEVYRPLKTFVPGSGGGYNQNSFPLAGEAGGGLFSPVFADTQGRVKVNTTTPLVSDLDTLLWILYLERLDFSMFYNYGAAWNGAEPRRGWDKLIRAHGYALDLQLENKGVRFNLGVGAGQVVGQAFEVYLTTGFDALF
jgi:hypothetical protein